ncbi:MAG: corrinoid protein [Chloroflexi bacterium]|nr:corrinoid protein [Chloroflexota bacterium]
MREMIQAIVEGDGDKALQETERALAQGANPLDLVSNGVLAAMDEVGARWRQGDLFIPEVIIAAEAAKEVMAVVKPHLSEDEVPTAGKVVIGTVKGDIHDIGKNIVKMMLEAGGFQVFDLGVDIPPEDFVEAVTRWKPDVLGMSALLTVTMLAMRDTIDALEKAELRDSTKVVVGGACVTSAFAGTIGADGYAADAASAVDLCRQLCSR